MSQCSSLPSPPSCGTVIMSFFIIKYTLWLNVIEGSTGPCQGSDCHGGCILVTDWMLDRDPQEEVFKAFRLFDDDDSGKISLRNLRRVARELGENMTDEELRAMIDEFDKDGDGESEFLLHLILVDFVNCMFQFALNCKWNFVCIFFVIIHHITLQKELQNNVHSMIPQQIQEENRQFTCTISLPVTV